MILKYICTRLKPKRPIDTNLKKRKWMILLVTIGAVNMIPTSSVTAASYIQSPSGKILNDVLQTEIGSDADILWEEVMDENGNRIQEVVQNQRNCSHNYVQGLLQKHEKNGEGCIYCIYHAKKCTKCGLIIIGALQDKIIYKKCPH